MTRSRYFLAAGGLLALLAALVFHDLDRRPLHHDEGVNGWFMMRMVQGEPFRYDPANYHGPSLYYLQLPLLAVTRAAESRRGVEAVYPGLTEATLRLGVATASLAVLALIAFAGDLLGRVAALAAALIAGLSPSLLFYSRMFIHEPLVLLFSLLFFLALMRFDHRQRPRDLVLVAVVAALGLATKETFVLSLAAVLGGWLGAETLLRLRWGGGAAGATGDAARRLSSLYRAARPWLALAAVLGLVSWAALFTAFLAHPVGVFDALAAFLPWGQEALETGHAKPLGYYLRELLLPYEWLVLALFTLGLAAAWLQAERAVLAAACWGLLALGGYSVIPYKTPWLVLNALLPMCLVAGFGVQAVIQWVANTARRRRPLALAALAASLLAALVPSASQALRLTFVEYDRDRHPQVYVHTDRELHELLARIEAFARSQGSREIAIDVVAPESWPLPVSLREYPRARFWGRLLAPPGPGGPVVIAGTTQRPELEERMQEGWERSSHLLRPGVELDLYLARPGAPTPFGAGDGPSHEAPEEL